jgi:hypothetical protein
LAGLLGFFSGFESGVMDLSGKCKTTAHNISLPRQISTPEDV